MDIINYDADYSGTGIPKGPYVSDAVKALLQAKYSTITNPQMYTFQAFVDSIGGLDGATWAKIEYLFIPLFSANITEGFTDVLGKNSQWLGSPNLTAWTLADGMLTQTATSETHLAKSILDYQQSLFGAVKYDSVGAANFLCHSEVANANVHISTSTSAFSANKYDGSLNQMANVPITITNGLLSYSLSGAQGISGDTQNAAFANSARGNLNIVPAFNLTKASNMSLGAVAGAYVMYNLYIQGYATGLTVAEAQTIEAAVNNFVSALAN